MSLSRREFLRGGFLRRREMAPPRRIRRGPLPVTLLEEPATPLAATPPEPALLNVRRAARVRLLEPACLAWLGVGCTTCAERCPVEGAIRLDAGKPAINAAVCDGCGVCADVCPAPQKAILVMALPKEAS